MDYEKACKIIKSQRGGGASVAFTLAEVLITLGIIGVVAVLTMPTLINNIQDRQFKAIFKKQVSVIFQALQKIIEEDGDFYIERQKNADLTVLHNSRVACEIMNKVKTVESGLDCSTLERKNTRLWHRDYKWYNKKGEPQYLNYGYAQNTFLTADGVLINFSCVDNVFVDVNGYKQPNVIGRDIFYFRLPINGGNAPVFFSDKEVNLCSAATGVTVVKIQQDNYEEDCKSGTGWGCSPKYFLE